MKTKKKVFKVQNSKKNSKQMKTKKKVFKVQNSKKNSKQMKVLMLNYEFPPLGGGAGNAMYYLLKEFSKNKKIEIDVITSSPSKKRLEQFSDNIKIYRLDVNKKELHYQSFSEIFLWSIKTFFLAKKLLKKESYDIIHCWTGWPSGFFGYVFRKKVPYIVALRGSDVPGFNPRFKILDKVFFSHISKIIWNKAEDVVANSEGLKTLALNTQKLPISVIYNGIDTKQFMPGNNKKKKQRLITVSRLIERKGIRHLIIAMQKIINKESDVELLVVGEGPGKKLLEALSKNLGVENNIRFMGRVKHDKLPALYKKSKIFILPSLHEGMSNSLLEAIASGLAIITTDTGGSKELVKDNGIIIRKKSSDDIAKAVIDLLEDKNKLERYKKKSRKIAEDLSWTKAAEKYYKKYKEVINPDNQ